MKNFRALNLAIKQYQDIKKLKLKGEVRNQVERASLSVCLNLTEGNAKLTIKERRRLFNIAYASCQETLTLLQIINNTILYAQANHLCAMIYLLQKNTVSLKLATARST